VIHADASRPRGHGRPGSRAGSLQSKRRRPGTQVRAVERAIHAECGTQSSGSGGENRIRRTACQGVTRVRAPGLASAPRRGSGHARLVHRVQALQRLYRANEHCAGITGEAGHDVQAVVHPVDKVHVGEPCGSEHERRSRRAPGTCVRRTIIRPAVGLDFHDPARARGQPWFLAHEERPEEGGCRLAWRADQEIATKDGTRGSGPGQERKTAITSAGNRAPKKNSTDGTSRSRTKSAVTEPSSASWIWRMNGNSLVWAPCAAVMKNGSVIR